MLRYLPRGKNFLADALSGMPQYNCAKEEAATSIILSKQIVAPALTQHQKTPKEKMTDDLTRC